MNTNSILKRDDQSDAKFDLILLGRVCIDLNPTPEGYYKSTADVDTFNRYLGGSPANIAVGMARLGKKIGFIAKVSNDQFGTFVTNYFKNEGIDNTHVTRCKGEENLGLAITEILSETESSIMMYRNGVADLSLSPEDVDEDYVSSARALLISGTALSASPSREAAFKAVAIARNKSIPVIFDIDYRPQNWKSKDEIAVYYSLMAGESDIILCSREEMSLTESLCIPNNCDDEVSAKYWMDKNAKLIVIKHGKEGSNAFFKDGERYKVKPFPVKLLKSFGGGDGYASAFLTGLLDGEEPQKCLSLASACAAMLVASKSCSADMPTLDALSEFEQRAVLEHGSMVEKF